MNIYEKLMAIQSHLRAPKNQFNKFGNYKYRSCEDILEAVKPLCAENNAVLVLTDDIVMVGDRYYVKATAKLIDTEVPNESIEVHAMAREEESKKGMDAAQVTGATSSYARKYALNALFEIDDNKDPDTNENRTESDTKAQTVHKAEAVPPAKAETAPPPKFRCECCNKELPLYKDGNGKTISLRKWAEGSKNKFGHILCKECMETFST